MRQATIKYKNWKAGILTETNEGEYLFKYCTEYVEQHPESFLTFTMPVRNAPCISYPKVEIHLPLKKIIVGELLQRLSKVQKLLRVSRVADHTITEERNIPMVLATKAFFLSILKIYEAMVPA